MEWTSVEDKLPEPTTEGIWDAKLYLCHIPDPHNRESYMTQVVWWLNNRFEGYPAGATKITHWMPLPSPPVSE